jgi:hypothetical protein
VLYSRRANSVVAESTEVLVLVLLRLELLPLLLQSHGLRSTEQLVGRDHHTARKDASTDTSNDHSLRKATSQFTAGLQQFGNKKNFRSRQTTEGI